MERLLILWTLSLLVSTVSAQQPVTPSPFLTIPPAPGDDLRFARGLIDLKSSDLGGRTWQVESLLDHITVVNVWATWCIPCRQEHAALQEFHAKAKLGNMLQVLTFSVDDDAVMVRSYLKEKGYTFPVIVDAKQAERVFGSGPGGLPQTWLVDRQGRQSDSFRSWPLGRILIEAEKAAERQ